MSASSSNPPSSNRRPTDVGALLHEGELFSGWFTANKLSNRFYIVNLDKAMDALGVSYTKMEDALLLARDAIYKETSWHKKYPFEYKAATIQLNYQKRYEPKLFGHAVAIIVALEEYAKKKNSYFNVYDFLRIIAAQYFVDGFDRRRYEALTEVYASWSVDHRREIFGGIGDSRNFEELCKASMEQVMSPELAKLMAFGHTSTKYCCEKLVEVVNKFPKQYHVGEVLSSGERASIESSTRLGSRNAASTLRVPREIDETQLRACF